jgi:ATP-binding cassette, subfamily C, bacterial CydD
MPYQSALPVLLLTPEAYLPLRAVAAQYHASAEGSVASEGIFQTLDTPLPRATRTTGAPAGPRTPVPDLRSAVISLDEVSDR